MVAETGNPEKLVKQLMENPGYLEPVVSKGGAEGTGKMSLEIITNAEHPTFDLITMIVPSSDWFTGVTACDMCDHETGEWKTGAVMDMLMPYDAGTVKAQSFTGKSKPMRKHKKIKMIKCSRKPKAFCRRSRRGKKKMGKIVASLATLKIEEKNNKNN
jgi:hypothetical protein